MWKKCGPLFIIGEIMVHIKKACSTDPSSVAHVEVGNKLFESWTVGVGTILWLLWVVVYD